MTDTTTLSELIDEFSANAFILADAGNGCSYGEKGRAVDYDEACGMEYAETAMSKLDTPHISDDGFVCAYASDWIIQGNGDNPYRVRLYF